MIQTAINQNFLSYSALICILFTASPNPVPTQKLRKFFLKKLTQVLIVIPLFIPTINRM